MGLSELAVRNRQFTTVVFLMLVALGASALVSIPKAEDPAFPIPTFLVVSVYPGASPKDVEKLVTKPIEDALHELEDVKRMRTTIEDGLALTEIEFTAGVDADKKYQDVLRQLDVARRTLPGDLASLEVKRYSASNVSVLQLALVGDHASYALLDREADRLKTRLEAIKSLKKVETWAYPKPEIRVSLDLEKLARLGIPFGQVVGALQQGNVDIPGGSLDAGARKFNLKTNGEFASLEDVRRTVVAGANGQVVRVGDLADVERRDEDLVSFARLDGRRAVWITVAQKDRENIFDTRVEVMAVVDAFSKELPPGLELVAGFDQSRNVAHRVGGFTRDFAIALLLVLVTLLPLGTRASLLVMLSIPLSLAIGVALLHLAGFSLNQLSIVGLVVALGLLVDDSIVVVENVTRFLREGRSPLQAAIEGTRQIGLAVLGCTATLVFAFVPLLALPGTPGQFIRSLPMAVVLTILGSLLVSLTIVPLLASVLLRAEGPEGNVFLRVMHRAVEGSYRPVLHRALGRPRLTLAVAGALFVGSLALLPVVGFSLFPKAGIPQFLVGVETPDGSNLAETDRAVRFVEAELRRHAEVRHVLSNVGAGNPTVYYNQTQERERANVGELFVQLDRYDPRRTPELLDELRRRLAEYPNARIEVKEFSNGPPIEAPVAMRLLGEDLGSLSRAATAVEEVLRGTPGARDVRNPLSTVRTDLRIAVDREKAGVLGVSLLDVQRVVRLGFAGLPAGKYREPNGDERTVNVRLPTDGHPTLPMLERLQIPSVTGALIPLRQVAAELELQSSPAVINHYDKVRSVTVSADVGTGFVTDRVTKDVLRRLAAVELPPGVRLVPAGEIESRQDSFGGLSGAALVAAFGILAVLVLEFRTFKSTLIVASVIPLGLVGGILALFLTGNTLSFTAAIGFIALVGIEVKNSILLVDFTNQLRAAGRSVDEAIEEAGETRFVPILLTTLTALGGLLPLALEDSALYSPLAWVIIGGLVSSTVLTRVVTPVMYKLLAPEVLGTGARATEVAPAPLAGPARVAHGGAAPA